MKPSQWLVIFSLDDVHYALYLTVVDRVVPAVAVTRLPKAPDIVRGLINVRGSIIPLINVRKRFSLPERKLNLDDQIIIAQTSKRPVGLVVDRVLNIIEYSPEAIIPTASIVHGMSYVNGVIKIMDEIILIHDLDTFLSLEEHSALDHAMAHGDGVNASSSH